MIAKKSIYIACAILFWVILAFNLGLFIELFYLYLTIDEFIVFSRWLYNLIVILYVVWLFVAVVIGYKKGQKWWQYIYIDKKWQGLCHYLKFKKE